MFELKSLLLFNHKRFFLAKHMLHNVFECDSRGMRGTAQKFYSRLGR